MSYQTEKKSISEDEVPIWALDVLGTSSKIKRFEKMAFGYYYGHDGYFVNHWIAKGFFIEAAKLGSVTARDALNNLKFNL